MGTEPSRFRVLGPLDVTIDGTPARVGGPRPRALLGVLLVHAGRVVSADRLIAQVWGDDPPATATAALHVHLSTLRKALGERLVTLPAGYLLTVEDDEIDARVFEKTVTGADVSGDPAGASAALAEALALWRGDAYAGIPAGPDVENEWLRLSELRLSAAEDRFEAELNLGRHAGSLPGLSALVAEQPTRQRLAGLRLLALHRSGRDGEALAAYRALRDRLADDLGAEPGPELAALARAIERGDPTLERPSAVPRPPSRFIGRRRELDDLAELLGRCRLLTVTGPGGVGKTRLALELARDTEPEHRDGVRVLELATSPPGSAVAERLAALFAVRAAEGGTLLDALTERLRPLRALVVVDNCEHLAEDCATLSAELLAHCPGLRILATSREPLGVDGEHVWPLSGLPAADAMRLLADRGRAARAAFTVTPADMPVARHLCRRLDGLPLAIELAAAQLRTRSLADVAEQLSRRLDLADERARTSPSRHRTMRAAIDWGHGLLGDEERSLFRRLSAFSGGWAADDAEIVTGHPREVLTRLADQSMVVAAPGDARTRFRMLELVREYAVERLRESAELRTVRDAHADRYAELAEEAAAGSADAAWLRRLREEVPNFRAAVSWSLGEGKRIEPAVRIAAALWWFWNDEGLTTAALRWLAPGLAEGAELAPELLARTLRAASTMTRSVGDLDGARALGERGLRAYRELGDDASVASALNGLCFTALAQRDYEAALVYGEECHRLAEAGGDELRGAVSLNPLGLALRGLGRWDEATAMFAEARGRLGAIGAASAEAASLANLATMARWRGEHAEAEGFYVEALGLYRGLDLRTGILVALEGLAAVRVAGGLAFEGMRLLTVVDREWGRLGVMPFNPDRVDDREATRAAARELLGADAESAIASAEGIGLAAVVAEVLGDGTG
ncbi:BTAD domain-containing putative transcriptional regulator [Phytomonospora endophytica]|uniref:Putative ATPase n=1 Tax=Phytomonospora endophytica TaxID=714109 RepID=A0A841G0G9_9ACTN|nr:BTAD domain-containing putative transcriptional regulator [Phytomonospora endophytica]MBB6038179.1 putative ATPase [Phytomonospora endophytica]GIG67360.1 SARP family transcriptional regulator [Phytomonospora endophytica]